MTPSGGPANVRGETSVVAGRDLSSPRETSIAGEERGETVCMLVQRVPQWVFSTP